MNKQILLVGRGGTIRAIMAMLLGEIGYRNITGVMTCKEGLEKLRTGDFVLVIIEIATDESVAGLDNIVGEIRQIGEAKVILAMGKAAKQESRGFANQPDAILDKPFEREEFGRIVTSTLKDSGIVEVS